MGHPDRRHQTVLMQRVRLLMRGWSLGWRWAPRSGVRRWVSWSARSPWRARARPAVGLKPR